MTDEITKPENDQNDKPKTVTDMFKPKKWGIAAKREAVKTAIKDLNPNESEHRIGIIFDDSGSMSSQVENKSKIDHAQIGVRNFVQQCNPKDTSLAIYPLNEKAQQLICDFDVLNLYIGTIRPTGGTPLYWVTIKILTECDLTRGVIFSDGEPTDGSGYYSTTEDSDSEERQSLKEKMISLAIEKKIPLDCIFIGYTTEKGYILLKEIADRTGGIFVHFKDAASLGQGLKYLSPAMRGMLLNAELKAKIERGETI
jgi:hypothetical protein